MDAFESSVLIAFVESGEELDRVGKDWSIDRRSAFSLIIPEGQDIQIDEPISLNSVHIPQNFYQELNNVGWAASSSEFKNDFIEKLENYQRQGGVLKLGQDSSIVDPEIENKTGEEKNLMAGLPSNSSEVEKDWFVRLVKLLSKRTVY